MVLVSAARDYINRFLQDISGMKVLILDSQTVSIVSVVYSQTELLQKEVFLVELVDSISKSKEPMSHLKAVYFLRPTSENIQHLRRQLANPRFGESHLFFSNILKDTQIHILADSDEQEVVQQVQEYYGDFVAIDPYHFTLNIPSNHMYMLPAVVDPPGLQHFCDRVVDGIAAVFLALKRRPVIRYQRTSDIAKRVAQETSKLMYQQESGLFDFRRTEISPLLLIVDRRDDPVTPLLNQWTYQAMVHELIGIHDNKVDLSSIGKLPKDQQEVVLSSEQDAFFKANMYENFGDIGMNIKKMVDDFQQVAKSNQNIQTIEDMAKFVDNYPEYRKMHGNVSKHVKLVTEMSKIVEERRLMLVSEMEQDLACNSGQVAAFEVKSTTYDRPEVSEQIGHGKSQPGNYCVEQNKKENLTEPRCSSENWKGNAVTNLLNNENVSDIDCLRLVMLYALHYEKESPVQLMQLFNKLASRSPKYKPGLVQFLLKQAGVDKRTGDLYGNRDLLNIARNMARGLKGVENVYIQHQPLLFQTMESIIKGRLRDVDYPFVGNHFQQGRLVL
ncbi:vacuolar protein sorting-associated protein 45 [Populus alba x Populus x berolinensis]|nr:vacuolar protein sorting-associated protein 45 [Populus alba x Populus x berolinensis]